MKRFYGTVTVAGETGPFGVDLDGRPVRTPGKRRLTVPFRPLADAIATEWADQSEMVEAAAMPLTRLANSAVDVVADRREQIVDEVARYGATDLVCYRADGPDDLFQRQDAAWQPLLDWIGARYGIKLEVTRGIMPVLQSEAALAEIKSVVAAFEDFPLTGLHAVTAAAGSVVIGLALADNRLGADDAFALSQLDESYQIELWGEDAEAAKRRRALNADIRAAARFLELCRG